jgi:hypothetical protein
LPHVQWHLTSGETMLPFLHWRCLQPIKHTHCS